MRRGAATLVLIISAEVLSAQQGVSTDELLRVTTDLTRAIEALPSSTRPRTLVADAGWLHDSVHRPPFWSGPVTRPSDVSRAYLQSLQVAAEVLRRQPSPEAMQAVAEDLEAKVEHCRRLGIGMGGSIRVTVHTRRAGEPVRNLQVRYRLKFYDVVARAEPGTFARISTPTESLLDPGRSWIWAFDPASGRESARTLVKISGQREMVVDVPVP